MTIWRYMCILMINQVLRSLTMRIQFTGASTHPTRLLSVISICRQMSTSARERLSPSFWTRWTGKETFFTTSECFHRHRLNIRDAVMSSSIRRYWKWERKCSVVDCLKVHFFTGIRSSRWLLIKSLPICIRHRKSHFRCCWRISVGGVGLVLRYSCVIRQLEAIGYRVLMTNLLWIWIRRTRCTRRRSIIWRQC